MSVYRSDHIRGSIQARERSEVLSGATTTTTTAAATVNEQRAGRLDRCNCYRQRGKATKARRVKQGAAGPGLDAKAGQPLSQRRQQLAARAAAHVLARHDLAAAGAQLNILLRQLTTEAKR